MQDPIISIIVTTYNMGAFIRRALESILKQITTFKIEIIVADDFSTDGTISIIKEFKRNYGEQIILLESNSNQGIVLNLRKALKWSKGKYIALLDADDYWITTDKIQKQIEIMEQNIRVDFVYTNFRYRNINGIEGGNGISNEFIPPHKKNFLTYLLSPYISPSCVCFKKDLFDINTYDALTNGFSVAQDYALFLDITSKGLGYYLKEITMEYTIRSGSLSRKNDITNKINALNEAYSIANRFIKNHPIPKRLNNIFDFKFHLKVLLAAWEADNIDLIQISLGNLSFIQFLKFDPKAAYIYIASRNKILYKLFRPWVLRKRPPGK